MQYLTNIFNYVVGQWQSYYFYLSPMTTSQLENTSTSSHIFIHWHRNFLNFTHLQFKMYVISNFKTLIPVTGASMSSIVFSWRKIAAPSLMIRSATASSTRPSLVRWAFRRSTRGFPSQSNTSFSVSRWLKGKGTAEDRAQTHGQYGNCKNNSVTQFLFCIVVREQWQARHKQHIIKEWIQKSYLRKPIHLQALFCSCMNTL